MKIFCKEECSKSARPEFIVQIPVDGERHKAEDIQ